MSIHDALSDGPDLVHRILHAMEDSIALIDQVGSLVFVNKCWSYQAASSASFVRGAVGDNFLLLCEGSEIPDGTRFARRFRKFFEGSSPAIDCYHSKSCPADCRGFKVRMSHVDPANKMALLVHTQKCTANNELDPEAFALLTDREKDVLGQIVCGRTSNSIAASLHLSINTVNNHRHAIMGKLGARNSADLVRMAIVGRENHE